MATTTTTTLEDAPAGTRTSFIPPYEASTVGNGDAKRPLDEKQHLIHDEPQPMTAAADAAPTTAEGDSTTASAPVEKDLALATGTANGHAGPGSPTSAHGSQAAVDPDTVLATQPASDLSRHATGTFASGAATTGFRNSTVHETLHERAETADTRLSASERTKILKAEGKNGKQIAKVLKAEAKAQDRILKTSIKELGNLQAVQKQAAKDEAAALKAYTRAMKIEQKATRAYNKAKADFERATADLQSATSTLENTRAHSKAQTEALKTKSLEVEQASLQKATDDRERAVKLADLKGTK